MRSAFRSIALLILLVATTARAQNSAQPAFSLENFRPAVDSKGYVTVNASQILGHLDFSLGLVTSYAHDVLHLQANGRSFPVEYFMPPQLKAALGVFKWVELGVSVPVHIMFGSRSPAYVEPANMNLNNNLS